MLYIYIFLKTLFAHFERKIDNTLGVTPLVVIPGNNLHHVITHNHSKRSIDGGGYVTALEVAGHQRLFGVPKNSLSVTLRSFLEGSIYFLGSALLLDLADKVDDGHVAH